MPYTSSICNKANTIKELPLSKKAKIAILGAGAWGSALALALARQGVEVALWSKDATQVAAITNTRVNTLYLPNHVMPDHIAATNDLASIFATYSDIIIAVPSTAYRQLLNSIKPYICSNRRYRFLSATKGMDSQNDFLPQTFNTVIGSEHAFGIITGPSFAQEVAANLPTALLIASHDCTFAQNMSDLFSSKTLAISISDDVMGAAVVGIIKNITAIAVGIADGLTLGANARSALITHGFTEMINITVALGGQVNTCTGIAGLGDLVLTCHSDLSRNRRFGLSIGRGQELDAPEMLVEGLANVALISNLAKHLHVVTPVCQAVYDVAHYRRNPREAIMKVLTGHSARMAIACD